MSDTDGALTLNLDTETDLDPLLDAARHARFVLIGTASPGGHEYQTWRAAITRRLVAEHGFGFVAVEADGPDQRPVDAAVRLESDTDPDQALARHGWPSWPLANTPTAALCRWLREHNAALPQRRRVGWYGLDAHPRHASLRTIADYLAERAPEHLATALSGGDAPLVPDEHLAAVTSLLSLVHEDTGDKEYAAQDEKLRAGAEGYYHALLTGGDFARNTRIAHLVATLEDLADHHGPNSRAVVWADDSQVGAFTADPHNLGGYLRERHGDTDVYAIGMVGGTGEVTAAPTWSEPARPVTVASPKPDSLEALLTGTTPRRAWWRLDADAPRWARESRQQRQFGVVDDPTDECWLDTTPADAYDALLWFPTTTPTEPVAPHAE